MERHAFVASVPFTLIEAIHVVVTYNLDADVYITKSFQDAQGVAERLSSVGLFRNVYLVDNVLLEYPITFKQCYHTVVNGWKLVRQLKKRPYDYGYYNNSGWLINSIFYTGFLKANKQCKQRFIEHGFNTYLNDYKDKPWYMRILINVFGFKCMDGSMLEALYLFEPDLLKARQDGEKRKLPKMDKNNKRFVEIINTTFDYKAEENQLKDKKIIIMEQGPQKVEFDKEAFWNEILEALDTKDAIIKPHPRQKSSTLQKTGIEISKNNSMPWEVYALNMDVENMVQLAIFSGSCLMPKYCFGLESTVIQLYKLLPVDYSYLGKDIVSFSEEIGKLYIDSRKFFAPSTLDELKEIYREIGIEK